MRTTPIKNETAGWIDWTRYIGAVSLARDRARSRSERKKLTTTMDVLLDLAEAQREMQKYDEKKGREHAA